METALAILMVLGIYVGVPMVIGFAVAATVVWTARRSKRAERAKALAEVEAEELAHAFKG